MNRYEPVAVICKSCGEIDSREFLEHEEEDIIIYSQELAVEGWDLRARGDNYCPDCALKNQSILKLAYLASPYSIGYDGTYDQPAGDQIKELRVQWATKAACYLLEKENIFAYSPIIQTHNMSVAFNLPEGYAFWKEVDRAMIDALKRVVVFQLSNWDKSKGITDEIAYAEFKGYEVIYLRPIDVVKWIHDRLVNNS